MTPHNADIPPDGKSVEARAGAYLNSLAKPPGSLGRLEALAVRLCGASDSLAPRTSPRAIMVFAADHGCVASGVSLWPQAVSTAVVKTLLAGGGGASVLARQASANLRVCDVGLNGPDLPDHALLTSARVRQGSRDMAQEPALTREEFERALAIGRREAEAVIANGAEILIAGEVGIGNTTAAAALAALLCDRPADGLIGAGAGADAASLSRKRAVVDSALARARSIDDPLARIASVCGLEIAAMAGYYLAAAAARKPILLDGVISGAAALIARSIEPDCVRFMIAAHLSSEPAHGIILQMLGLEPFLEWSMRLGEGSGALTLLPLLDMAAALMSDMATLEDALALANA
jgi:nicotinate-nucleotide--dimethylbenzimidazole phosphoribosyltransferase